MVSEWECVEQALLDFTSVELAVSVAVEVAELGHVLALLCRAEKI